MFSEAEREVLCLIDDNIPRIVEYLRHLISFKTVTPPMGERANSADFMAFQQSIATELLEMDFAVETWEVDASQLDVFPGSGVIADRDLAGMPVLEGQLEGRGGGRSLILNGHYDVVPVGSKSSWRHDPFRGDVRDGKIFGRGACDMKGGIAAMMQAVKFIREAGLRLGGELTVQTVPDEEASSMGALSCCQRGCKADAVIIPEPTNMNILLASRGNLTGEITVFGRSGHADMAPRHWTAGGPANAISKAAKVVRALEDLAEEWRIRPDKQHKYLDPDTIVPTTIKGGEWILMHPDRVAVEFSANFIPSTTNIGDEIAEKIMSVAATDSWMKAHPPKIEYHPWIYGTEISEDEPIVQTIKQSAKSLELDPQYIGWGTLSDSVHFVNYARIPTVSIGPGDEKIAHTSDEFITVEQLVDATKVIALAILRWCSPS